MEYTQFFKYSANIFNLGGVQEEGEKDGVGKRVEESPEVFDHPGFSTFFFLC